MGAPPGSQVSALPANLPFRLISKTIGSGAYASIRKATPVNAPSPIIAVKFIHKEHAFRVGRLRPKQIQLELALHQQVCPHKNIIRFLSTGEDSSWIWLALELAEGGDLFDKIEADEGVSPEVAHLYFSQLVAAVSWCHDKGVAHRDVKPENMLLSGSGDMKLADFGLATQFMNAKTGERKVCGMVCGSPPYIAPEILAVGKANETLKRKKIEGEKLGYDPDGADVFSCGIVLFVLLAGNTPWDCPDQEQSWEFAEWVKTRGEPSDELWEKIPPEVKGLLKGVLAVEPAERWSWAAVRRHEWMRRRNPYMDGNGNATDQVGLATCMLEKLKINFAQEVGASQQQRSQPTQRMDIDEPAPLETDWEAPPPPGSQLVRPSQQMHPSTQALRYLPGFLADLHSDPVMSQFSATPSLPETLTQAARKYSDIMPSTSLTKFYSTMPPVQLSSLLLSALDRLSVPIPHPKPIWDPARNRQEYRIRTLDSRGQDLYGGVVVDIIGVEGREVVRVCLNKAKGDPIGWRRFFKEVVLCCRDGVLCFDEDF
ncbi:hypothetical protein B0A48_11233 [Cryoendolithus antarcticus]|uniref:Protein kinase domain-containing protein n=1 Tax=Cryoendolithus antarcticus TaxID=1507870 RepID=A0A1V8SV75_9PEZI|nr:hypothetical protein B0A48_11233 [Cryoendolithus antarcticus]